MLGIINYIYLLEPKQNLSYDNALNNFDKWISFILYIETQKSLELVCRVHIEIFLMNFYFHM